MFALDTNVVSETRRRKPHGAVRAWYESVDPEIVFVPAPVFGELQKGVELTRLQDPGRAKELEHWVDDVAAFARIVPAGEAAYRLHSRLMIGRSETLYLDALISAIAITNNMTVATRNVRDFAQFDVPVFNPFEFTS